MAFETWSPQPTRWGERPPGDGWTISGYQTVNVNEGGNKYNGGFPVSRQIPIYMRNDGVGQAASGGASAAAPASGTPSLRIEPQNPVPLVGQSSGSLPLLASGGFDALNRPITAEDRSYLGVNTESVEDFMKRYNAQRDWVRAGMDITNWSPQGMIDPNKGKTLEVKEPVVQSDLMVGQNASVDGNALGFTRAKSSARKAGLTTKGTSRLRITRGQTSASSGLNIGV